MFIKVTISDALYESFPITLQNQYNCQHIIKLTTEHLQSVSDRLFLTDICNATVAEIREDAIVLCCRLQRERERRCATGLQKVFSS